jgi:hypothetical protein
MVFSIIFLSCSFYGAHSVIVNQTPFAGPTEFNIIGNIIMGFVGRFRYWNVSGCGGSELNEAVYVAWVVSTRQHPHTATPPFLLPPLTPCATSPDPQFNMVSFTLKAWGYIATSVIGDERGGHSRI